MRAIEFKTCIKENSILIPRKIQPQFYGNAHNRVRVVVFMEDSEIYDEKAYRQLARNQFLKGYAETDSIYDL